MNRWMDGCVVVVVIVVVVVMKKRNAMVKLYLARVDVWLCYIFTWPAFILNICHSGDL